jgi:hypothetical protein
MLYGAIATRSWYMGAIAAVLFSAVVGATVSQRWSRLPVYVFALILTYQWLSYVIPEITSGFLLPHLSRMPPLQVVLVFVPATLAFLLVGYCCYVAHRYFANTTGTSNQRLERP